MPSRASTTTSIDSREVWSATNRQDRTLAERNQLGVSSSAYRPGPYSTVIEQGAIDFVEWYAAAVGVSRHRSRPGLTADRQSLVSRQGSPGADSFAQSRRHFVIR